jgi:tetratricopeptide (TPR) repeat protein
MYLPKSSRWSMNRRRRRPNYFGWVIFGLVVLFGYYFNQVYLPTSAMLAGPTPTETRSPESYATEAEGLFKDGKLTQAIDAYQSAIKASPQDPTLYVALARIQVWAGKYEDAQKNAENALLLNNANAMAHAVKAWALDFQDGKNGEALTEIEEALKLDDRNAVIQSYYVEILVDSGFDNYAKAADQSRIALALDQNIVETHRARGYVYSVTDNREQAISEYDQAIKINPHLARLHLEQGLNYRAISAKDQAIQEFTLAITLDPTDPQPNYLISRTYATFGEYSKALQYADSAVQNSPSDANLRGNLGVMYYRNLLWNDAVRELGLAVFGGTAKLNNVGADGKDTVEVKGIPLSDSQLVAEFYFTLGLALARTNQCGEALQLVQELQSKVPTDQVAMDAANKTIGICQENLNNPAVDTPTPTLESPATPAETETPVPTP